METVIIEGFDDKMEYDRPTAEGPHYLTFTLQLENQPQTYRVHGSVARRLATRILAALQPIELDDSIGADE